MSWAFVGFLPDLYALRLSFMQNIQKNPKKSYKPYSNFLHFLLFFKQVQLSGLLVVLNYANVDALGQHVCPI
jgi:hypothetical protein